MSVLNLQDLVISEVQLPNNADEKQVILEGSDSEQDLADSFSVSPRSEHDSQTDEQSNTTIDDDSDTGYSSESPRTTSLPAVPWINRKPHRLPDTIGLDRLRKNMEKSPAFDNDDLHQIDEYIKYLKVEQEKQKKDASHGIYAYQNKTTFRSAATIRAVR